MASNGYGNQGSSLLILYKIVNTDSDKDDPHFNAFQMPRGSATTLKSVKESCEALRYMNHLGADGYHWRVCVEDKPVPGGSNEKTFSWWDIQDENARLPVKEASSAQLAKFFAPKRGEASTADVAAKAAKGAFKSLGKALDSVAGASGASDQGPPVSVVAFKLLDLMKMHDDFSSKYGGKAPAGPVAPRPRAPAPARQQQPPRSAAPPTRQRSNQQQAARQPQRQPQQQQQRQQQPQTASLLDFGSDPSAPSSRRTLNHTTSSPAAFDQMHAASSASKPAPPSNESRAEKLKREYAQKQQTSNRVWDDVDQRWVEVCPKSGAAAARSTASAPPGANVQKKKEVGISLDPSNAAGKSHEVQAAVHKRVNDMRESQAKALDEIRQREEQKKKNDDEEDVVRKRLEPKIKAWSEEHGKKKQLRALIGTLQNILWPEANWKPIGLGDLLDDSKCKRAFHKASRVVHPDKTHHLDAEKRFLAKRIFDALSQAKTEFDNGTK